LITVAGGGAISDFNVTPALQGCAPFSVDMVNNSTGTTYVWDWDDGSPTTTTFEPSHTYTVPGTYDIQLIAFLPGAGCINYDTSYVQIVVGNAIVPVADFDYTIDCGTTSIILTQTGTGGLDYDWDMGDGTNYTGPNVTHDYGTTGQFTVTLTTGDATCGTQDIHTVVIDVVDNFITWTSNDPTCYQFSDGSVTINTQYSNGGEIFSVTDSLGNELIVGGSNAANNLPAGTYNVNVDLGLGCADSTTITLFNPAEILVDLGLTHVACNGDATGIAEVIGGSGGVAPLSYFWNPNPGNQSGQGADSTGTMAAGDYVLQVNDDDGCSNTFDFTITEPPALVFTQLGSDAAFCRLEDYQSGNGVVYAAAGGGTPDYDYVWLNLQDSSATSFTTWGGLNPGQYEITVFDNNGCILIEEITVDEAFPIAEFTMSSPEFDFEFGGTAPVSVHFINESQYFANPNNPNADTTFFWNFNYDNSSWVISHDIDETFDTTYTEGGTYEVCLVAINKNGCTDTLCKDVIIYDPPLFQPVNIFTPNNDGDNDEFTFLSVSQAISSFECTVVDRWGVVMIEFDDITDTWDGTDKSGSECKDGVYFYTYRAVADNSEVIEGQGNVTIIRGK